MPKSRNQAAGESRTTGQPNALEHCFKPSAFTVVRLEDLNEIANLKSDLIACYQPVNSQELFAIERIAIAQQMMLRGARLEAGLFTAALDETLDRTGLHPITPMCNELAGDGDIEITRAQNRNFAAAEGFRRMCRESNVWSVLLRYQAQAERLIAGQSRILTASNACVPKCRLIPASEPNHQ